MDGTLAEGTQVPFRRWEDWERSRIRKLKREAQRKREMERAYHGLRPGVRAPEQYSMAFSEFNDNDNSSLAPSEDDRWGAQIGGYNENAPQWAPPPITLMPDEQLLQAAETLGGDELEAMLEQGWDERPYRENRDSSATMSSTGPFGSKYQLSDHGVMMPPPPLTGRFDSYAPVSTRTPSPGPGTTQFQQPYPEVHSPMSLSGNNNGSSSALDFQTHIKKRSASGRIRNDSEEMLRNPSGGSSPSLGDWGPLGPLDPQNAPPSPATPRPYMPTGRRI